MNDLFDFVNKQLSGSTVNEMSKQIGADKDSTENAVSLALPLMFGALARNTAQPDGAESLDRALYEDHDGSVLENLSSILGNPAQYGAPGILRHLFGAKRSPVEAGIGRASGLDPAKVSQILMMLAPIVMAALGRKKRQQQLDSGGLRDMLNQERSRIENQLPVNVPYTDVIDRDNDDDIASSIGKIGADILGQLLRGR